jgi:hypothetical protein
VVRRRTPSSPPPAVTAAPCSACPHRSFGSKAAADRGAYAVPSLTWVGLSWDDVRDYRIPRAGLQRLTAADEKRAASLLRHEGVAGDAAWVEALEESLARRQKMELEGALMLGVDFLSRTLVPERVAAALGAAGLDGGGDDEEGEEEGGEGELANDDGGELDVAADLSDKDELGNGGPPPSDDGGYFDGSGYDGAPGAMLSLATAGEDERRWFATSASDGRQRQRRYDDSSAEYDERMFEDGGEGDAAVVEEQEEGSGGGAEGEIEEECGGGTAQVANDDDDLNALFTAVGTAVATVQPSARGREAEERAWWAAAAQRRDQSSEGSR